MDDPTRKQAGVAAEEAACKFLVRHGLTLIDRNYRCRGGELDLIMLDGKTLALIEVRYRASNDFGGASASVTWTKQRRLILAARHLLTTRRELNRYPARFDVVAITGGNARPLEIDWIKAAFIADR
jgi:putative endonuclease